MKSAMATTVSVITAEIVKIIMRNKRLKEIDL
jgi:hypothetical protein